MAILRKQKGKRDNWGTPRPVYEKRNGLWRFTVDLCAEKWNAKHANYISLEKGQDSLARSVVWQGRCWLQPPYSEIWAWIEKAWMATLSRSKRPTAEVIDMLLPARTDSDWFHEFIVPYGRPEFIRGRINMIPPPGWHGKRDQPGEASIFATFSPRWIANDLWRNTMGVGGPKR